MDGKRIINVAYPRDPVENSAYNGDILTANALSDFKKYLLDEVLLRNSDNAIDGRLEMSGRKIKVLNAVNKEYITVRLKAVTDELNGILERINKLEKIKLNTKNETTNSSQNCPAKMGNIIACRKYQR